MRAQRAASKDRQAALGSAGCVDARHRREACDAAAAWRADPSAAAAVAGSESLRRDQERGPSHKAHGIPGGGIQADLAFTEPRTHVAAAGITPLAEPRADIAWPFLVVAATAASLQCIFVSPRGTFSEMTSCMRAQTQVRFQERGAGAADCSRAVRAHLSREHQPPALARADFHAHGAEARGRERNTDCRERKLSFWQ